jgi:hypothetical protein
LRESISAGLRTALSTGLLILLGACASAPSGHFSFALAASQAQAPGVWSLSSLPSHGRIDLTAHTGEETDPQQSTHLRLRFGDSDRTFSVAALDMNDPGCQGAYSFALEYSKQWNSSQTEYFEHKLPWGQPLKIRLEWWPDGRLEVEIANVGKRVLDWRGPGGGFEIRLLAGRLQVDDLDYRNLSAS